MIIILALVWTMPQCMTNRTIHSKFKQVQKVQYKQEDETKNKHHSCTALNCNLVQITTDGTIDMVRKKRDIGIQYRHEKKDDIKGFIPKPVARPEYSTVYQHQGMLLQNLHHRYLYIVIQLPHVNALHQKIPSFPNCEDYGICRASNPNPLQDYTRTNDNELHQQICQNFHTDYLQEMDIIVKIESRIEQKNNETLLVLLPNRGPVTSIEHNKNKEIRMRTKRAIPALAISQGAAAIGRMLIKGINAIINAKRASSFNNTFKSLNANVEITHNRLVTIEN